MYHVQIRPTLYYIILVEILLFIYIWDSEWLYRTESYSVCPTDGY